MRSICMSRGGRKNQAEKMKGNYKSISKGRKNFWYEIVFQKR